VNRRRRAQYASQSPSGPAPDPHLTNLPAPDVGVSDPLLTQWQRTRGGRKALLTTLETNLVAELALDGTTRIHGELGRLTFQPDGNGVQCHLCGEFLRNLGQHVRRTHGMDPDDYRELIGLDRHTTLAAPVFSTRIAALNVDLNRGRHLTTRHGRNAPMPSRRLQARLRGSQQARAQETVEVGCSRCGTLIIVPKRRVNVAWSERGALGRQLDPSPICKRCKVEQHGQGQERLVASDG
jgi:hypothetical protein